MKKKTVSLRNQIVGRQLLFTLLSLLLCAIFFLSVMSAQIRETIENDIAYFLETANNELESKIDIMADTVIALRNNEALGEYLNTARHSGGSQETMNTLSQTFARDAGLYSVRNLTDNAIPFVESLLLTDMGGNTLLTSYYAISTEKDDEIRLYLTALNQRFEKTGLDHTFYTDENYIYVCRVFYNRSFRAIGSMIFALRIDSISGMPLRKNSYPDLVWKLTDSAGRTLTSINCNELTPNPLEVMSAKAPHSWKNQYMYDARQFSMNFSSLLALPESLIPNMLISSLRFYAIGVVLILFGCALLTAWFSLRITKPLSVIAHRLEQVGRQDFSIKLPEYETTEFQAISASFNAMTEAICRMIEEDREKRLLIQEIDLKFAMSQMNPHFMFNVLNDISLLARLHGDPEVGEMLGTFAKLIKATIYRQGGDTISIQQELEYVGYYLRIQHFRYEDRLSYQLFTQDDALKDLMIPKLILQSVVENAVVHGCEPKVGKCQINIKISRDGDFALLEVTDDGPGFPGVCGEVMLPLESKAPPSGSHNQVGLDNIFKIIRLTYGEKSGLRVFSDPGHGTHVMIRIPIL